MSRLRGRPARPGASAGVPDTSTVSRRRVLIGSAGGLAAAALAACGSSETSAAAAPTEPAVPGGTLGLGIVGLIVRDIPASLVFYRRLGLAVPEDVDTSGGAVRFRMPNDTIFVWETVEYTRAGFDSTYRLTGAGDADRKVTLEFGFADADEVTAKHDELVAAGAPSYEAPVTWNDGTIRFAMVVDPDGNRVGLRWPLAS